MKKFYDFLSQSKYRLAGMERVLYGEQGLEDMGIANFDKLAIRGYNELHKYCFNNVCKFNDDSAFGRYVRERNLTLDDLKNMFVSSNPLPDNASRELLIEAYGKLARGVRQLSSKKILKVYGAKDKNKEHIKDFVLDVDLFQFFNGLFVDAVNEQREVFDELNKGNRDLQFTATTASKAVLKEIDKSFAQLTHDYNEKVLDSKKGVRPIYDAVVDYIDTLDIMGITAGVRERVKFAGTKYAPVRVDFGKVGSMGE